MSRHRAIARVAGDIAPRDLQRTRRLRCIGYVDSPTGYNSIASHLPDNATSAADGTVNLLPRGKIIPSILEMDVRLQKKTAAACRHRPQWKPEQRKMFPIVEALQSDRRDYAEQRGEVGAALRGHADKRHG